MKFPRGPLTGFTARTPENSHYAAAISGADLWFLELRSKENREDLLRYIEALFYLIYKPGASTVEQHR